MGRQSGGAATATLKIWRRFRNTNGVPGRWGLQSEKAFRYTLVGILEKNFGVQVANVTDYDDRGVVFERSDQVEVDVIVKNGLLLICELKSSIGKVRMCIFERKARFYEQCHQRTANRLIVISPMNDRRAGAQGSGAVGDRDPWRFDRGGGIMRRRKIGGWSGF